ncbi:MAG: HAD family hydrolase [candidate division Zixibacteria bacterium]|nr:HAD family hydrolase [candidate division Zixibacteria bacterium]
MMVKLKPRALIFDLGSTLIEYESVPWDELNILCLQNARKFLKVNDYDVPEQEEFYRIFEEIKAQYRQQAAETLVEWDVPQITQLFFEKLDIKYDADLIDEFFDFYYEPVDEKLYVYDDILETLEKLKNKYPVMGLISNTVFPERVHLQELARFGIEPFLNFTLFSSSFKLRKPHPDIFRKAANLAGYAPSECVYIGDRYIEDVQGPAEVGMPAILKIVENRTYPENMSYNIPRIKTLSDLLDILEN